MSAQFAGPDITDLTDPRLTFIPGHNVTIPKHGMLVHYSKDETLGPSCELFVKHMKKRSDGGNVKEMAVDDLPHDFMVICSVFNWMGCWAGQRTDEDLEEIAKWVVGIPLDV